MKNNKRKYLFGATVLVATATTGVTAHADNIENVNSTTVNISAQTKAQDAAESVETATQNQQKAQEIFDKASQNQQKTQADLDQATTDVANANANVENTKTQLDEAAKVKEQATPEAIQDAKQAVDKQQQVVDNAQKTVDSAQKEVDAQQPQTTTAKDALDKANASVETTKQALDQATSAVDKAKTDISDQEQARADVAQLEKQQAKEQATVDSAQKEFDEAQAHKKQADQNVKDAQNNKDRVNELVSDKTKAAKNAQTAVDNAQKALDATGAKDTLDKAQTAFDQTNKELAQTTFDRNDAKTALENADKTVADAQNTVSNAQTAKDQAQTSVNQDTQAVNDAKSKLDSAKQALANATKQDDSDIYNSFDITVNENFKRAVQKYTNDLYNNADDKTLNADFQAMKDAYDNGDNAIKINYHLPEKYNYVVYDKGGAHTTDDVVSHLNGKQVLTVEKFKTAFINKLRDTLGISDKTGHVYLNQAVIDIANYLSYSGNTEDINPSQKNPKFAQFVQETANKYNISAQTLYQTITPILYPEYSDSLTTLNITFTQILKRTLTTVHRSLNQDMNPGYDMYDRNGNIIYANDKVYSFAKNMLGISKWEKNANQNTDQKGQYFGYWSLYFPTSMRLNSQKFGEDDLGGRDQYMYIPRSTVANNPKFDKTVIPVSNTTTTDTTSLQKAVNNAQTALDQATAKLAQSQNALNKANSDLQNAQTALNTAKTTQANIKQTLDSKEAKVNQLTQQVEDAKTALDNAKQTYEASLKDTAQKEATLKQAQDALTKANAELADAKDLKTKIYDQFNKAMMNRTHADGNYQAKYEALHSAKTKLDKTNEALKTAQQQTDKNPAELRSILKESIEKQATAKGNYLDALDLQKQTQAAFDKQAKVLSDLEAKLKAAKDDLATATSKLNTAKETFDKLSHAEENFNEATDNYNAALREYEDAKAKLAKATSANDEAKQLVTMAKANLDLANNNLTRAKGRLDREKFAVLNFENAYRDAQRNNPTHELRKVKSGNVHVSERKDATELPQMGERTSGILATLGMSLLGIFGLAGVSRRKFVRK